MGCRRKKGREEGGEEMHTGNCDMMDWNCAGFKRPESRRNSSSVRMVPRERLAAAGSTPIVVIDLWMDGWIERNGWAMDEEAVMRVGW